VKNREKQCVSRLFSVFNLVKYSGNYTFCLILHQKKIVYLSQNVGQVCTNPKSHEARVTQFYRLALNICVPPVCNLLHVTFLTPKLFNCRQDFSKICSPAGIGLFIIFFDYFNILFPKRFNRLVFVIEINYFLSGRN